MESGSLLCETQIISLLGRFEGGAMQIVESPRF
jgi:hypothetical protein